MFPIRLCRICIILDNILRLCKGEEGEGFAFINIYIDTFLCFQINVSIDFRVFCNMCVYMRTYLFIYFTILKYSHFNIFIYNLDFYFFTYCFCQ